MNDSKAMILAERKLFLGKEKAIPILIASLLVIACTIAIFCQRPDDVEFVEHLYNNTHEKVAEATMIGPPYSLHPINALNGLDVQIKNKDGTVQTYTFSGEEDSCMISMKDFHSSVGFLNSVGYTDVHSIICSGMRHEVLNEIDGDIDAPLGGRTAETEQEARPEPKPAKTQKKQKI